MRFKQINLRKLWLSLLLLVGATAIAIPGIQEVAADGDVAKVGTTEYATIGDAVTAATEGQTIQIIKAGDYTLPSLPKNVTIEGAVDDVVFNHTTGGNVASIPNGATFKNVAFNFGNLDYHGFQHAGTINMEDCTLNGRLSSYGDMNFTNCSFNQSYSDYHMWTYAGNVTYDNCTFTNSVTGKFLNVYNESGATKYTVTVNNCKFFNNASTANKAAINVKATCGSKLLTYDVIINNCTTEGAFPEASTSDALVVLNSVVQVDDRTASGIDNITVTQDGVLIYPAAVAAIGETKYPTLQAAVDAALQMGGTVTVELIEDISGETVTIKEVANFKLTIDGKNKTVDATIVVDGLRGNGGSTTNGASVTLQNIAFVKTTATDGIQASHYPHHLTIQDCTYSGFDSDKWFLNASVDGPLYGVTVKNVTVEKARLIYANMADDAVFQNITATTDCKVGFNVKTSGTALIENCQVTTSKYAFRDYSDAYEGTFTLKDNTFVSTSTATDEGAIVIRGGAVGTAHVNVESGTYTGPVKVLNNKEGVLAISGGYFSEEFPQEYIAADLIAQGKVCAPATDKEGFYTVGDPHYVAQIGITKYVSLAAAVEAAQANDVITMIDDDNVSLTTAGSEITINKPLTITGAVDENGKPLYTIYGSSNGALSNSSFNDLFLSCSTGTITISNVKFDGFGNEISSVMGHSPVFIGSSNQNAVIENVYISNLNCEGIHINGGTFTIKDSNIDCSKTANSIFTKGICVVNNAQGTIENTKITGVDCDDPNDTSAAIELQGSGNITISGCTIQTNTIGIATAPVGELTAGTSQVTVSDCTVESHNIAIFSDGEKGALTSISSGNYSGLLMAGDNDEGLSISGGLFEDEPELAYCAEGFAPADNTDAATKEAYPYTVEELPDVAKIGDVKYKSLQKALDAAHEMTGDVTITLLDDISDYSIVHQKAGLNVTIDGADKKVTGNIVIDGDGRASGTETLTIQNIKFEGDGTNFCSGTSSFVEVPSCKTEGTPYYTNKYNYAHNITIDNCSFTSTTSGLTMAAVRATSGAGLYNITISNSTGSNLHSLAQLVGTTGGTITSNTVSSSESFVNVNGGGGEFTISGNTFTSAEGADGYGIRENGTSTAVITLTDNAFTAASAVVLGKGNNDAKGTINVVSGTYVGDITKTTASTGKIVISGGKFSAPLADAQYADFIADGLCGVNGLYPEEELAKNGIGTAVASVTSGETVLKYASLEAAISAAPDGATVTLLANSSGNGIKVPEGKYTTGLTVDFGGFTYTMDGEMVGSTGTQTQAFQLLKDNKITFKNGTITSEKAKMLVQNYSDLTLEGMTLTLDNPNYAKAYTLSNNNGNVVIDGTTINANPAGAFAFDVCRYASYPSVSVTVKGESVINGNIEVSASNNDPKDGFGLTLEEGTFNGNIVLDASAEAVLNATPEKAVIKKSNSLTTVVAPQDYKWVDNGDGTSTLAPCVYVAQIGETKYESFTAAVNAATTGQTIELLADITTETGNKSLKEGVTLDGKGKTISGDIAIYISKNGGTVQNVNFKNIHNASNKKSAIYSEYLEGTATITGCTFDNCDWDAIQIIPVAGANVVITNNTFSDDTEDGVKQKRYIHVQSAKNVDFSATITENVMLGNNGGPMDIYYPTDKSKLNLTNNYIEAVDDVLCILIKDDDGFAGELAFPAYTTADKEETYSPEAYVQNDQYSAKFYMTFAEAATAAGNDKVVSLVTNVTDPYVMSEGQILKVKKNGKTFNKPKGPDGFEVKDKTTDGVTTYTLVEADIEYTTLAGVVSYKAWSNTVVSGSGTYKLLKDITASARIVPGISAADVTLDLNGHTLTSTASDNTVLLSRNGTASAAKTFSIVDTSTDGGGKIVANTSANAAIMVTGDYNEVTIGEGVTIDGNCVAITGSGSNSADNCKLTVNGTINGGDDFAIATNGSLTKNATININDGAVLTSNVTAVYLPGTGTTNISGGTITGSNGIYVKSGELNITGGEITGNGETAEFVHNPNGTSIVGAALVVENCSYPGGAPTVNVTGGTFTSANADAIASYSYGDGNEPIGQFVHGGYFSTELDRAICENGKKTVPSTVKEGYYELGDIVYVAKIGETQYETLEEAWNAVNDGETITLLANCEGNGLIAPQDKFKTNGLTVDFAGFTYNVTGNLVGSSGTESQAFQLLKDNKITFKGGTITSEKAKFLVQNYSNLTLEGMTLTLNNANYASAYTLSNNNGNVVIDGTTINANPAGGFAFDVCRYSSYPSVNVTVTGNSVINGDVEVSASGSEAKDGFKLMFESATLNGEIVLDESAKTAMANTSDKAKVSKRNTLTDIVAPDDYDWKDNGDGTSSLALTEEMEMVLIHDVPYPVTKTATYKKVTYKRTFESRRLGKNQCWYVPFDYTITGEEDATFFKIHLISASTTAGEVQDNTQVNIYIEKMSAGEKLTANRPYIIRANKTDYEFVVEPENGVTLYAPNELSRLHLSTSEFYYDFYGSYVKTQATKNRDWMSLLASGSIAWNATANATLKSYVWYIRITPNGDNADYSKINLNFVEEDSENATKINSIEEDADEIEGIYSANGTKKETLSKGLNIIKYKSGKTKKIYK